MPTPQERYRNNVKAGIFVTVTILLALAVVAVLKDAGSWFQPRNTYAITYSVDSGVQALSEGSLVRVGGIEMGRVVGVQLADLLDGPNSRGLSDEPFETIVVEVELDPRVPLYSNAVAFVKSALIGADAWIEITSVGSNGDLDGDTQQDGIRLVPDRLADSRNWLRGTDGGTLLAAVLGPEDARKASEIIDNVNSITGNVRTDYAEHISPFFADAHVAAAEARELMQRVRGEDWPRWAFSVDRILVNALSASDKLDLAMGEGQALVSDARAGVADIRSVVTENAPKVNEFVDRLNAASEDVQELAARLADRTIDKVEALLDRGQDGIDAFARTTERLEVEFDLMAPVLQDSLASFNLAASELALATSELRSSPWRLLYRPSKDELEHENLYFAATKFAFAASELKMATQTVERALATHHDFLEANPARLEELQESLAESYERYEAAQRDLLDILRSTPTEEGAGD